MNASLKLEHRPVDDLPGVDTIDFKSAMRSLAAAVCVVTMRAGDQRNGMTATAVCSVTADPPSLLVVVNRGNRSHPLILEAGTFAVHILSATQAALAAHFACCSDEPFKDIRVHDGVTGSPIIDDCDCVLECVVSSTQDVGTHTILVGRVVSAKPTISPPLIYSHGLFGSFAGLS